MCSADAALLADIGGTNARFGFLTGNRITDIRILPTADHAGPASAARAYLDGRNISAAALAIAGPVDVDVIRLTNAGWEFSRSGLAADLDLDHIHVVNDFTAQALALPLLDTGDYRRIGGPAEIPVATKAVLGPGTGLGVSGLIRDGNDWIPLSTEGGHVTLAARTEEEDMVIAGLRDRFGHVSAERVLSGPGLVNLMDVLAAAAGSSNACAEPADVTDAAAGGDALARRAVSLFCDFLGTVAADVALTYGARGGVYIAGGIAPRLGDLFDGSGFRARFDDKGRFSDYLRAIPTCLVTAPHPALTGLRALLAGNSAGSV